MKYILAAINEDLIKAWQAWFSDQPNVLLHQGDATILACDAIVSPANSFGFMDGGIDWALSDRLGWDLQDKLQQMIHELPMGELLVGQSLTLETGDPSIPYLISAPTMRVPMSFQIATSVNAYLAMKAILIAARSHPEIETVVIPGLCTGVGRMPAEISAKQMFLAFEEIELGKKPRFEEFGDAQRYHWDINQDGLIWDY